MKFRMLFFFCCLVSGMIFAGENLIVNGNFADGAKAWRLQKPDAASSAAIVGDSAVPGGSAKVLRLERRAADAKPWQPYAVSDAIKLEPDTEYEIECYLRTEKIVSAPRSGAHIAVSAGNKTLHYGFDGLWKYDHGTAQWGKISRRFNSKYFEGKPVEVSARIRNSAGVAFFGNFSLKKVAVKKTEHTFGMNMFPFCFLGNGSFGIAENIPGFLGFRAELPSRPAAFYQEKEACLMLELPDFLTLTGVCDNHLLVREDGKRRIRSHEIKSSLPSKIRPRHTRYEIVFDRNFTRFIGQNWYSQKIFLQPRPGSVGKRGRIFWSLKIGGEVLPEASGQVEILPAVRFPEFPAEKFRFFISFPGALNSPFPEAAEKYAAFYRSLSRLPGRLRNLDERDSVPGFEDAIMIGGDDFLFPMRELREKMHKARSEMPYDGKRFLANHYKVDDPEKKFETYLRDAVREWRRLMPEVKIAVWDFEPGVHGKDRAGLERFAKVCAIDPVPTAAEVEGKYKQRFFEYTVKLHADFIQKMVRIFREEAPGTEFWLCSDPLSAGPKRISDWCAVDVALADPVTDLHFHMPYYCGTRYFDDVKKNIRELKKPFFPLNDPAERQLSFFRQYTPDKLRQNIVATAALGGKGFGLWPDDALDGNYFHRIADAYQTVAGAEKFYSGGKRCEEEFSFTPVNVSEQKIRDDEGKEAVLRFPDFGRTLRATAHRLGKQILFTLFHYDSDPPMILEISGPGIKPFLAELLPDGVVAICSDRIPAQEPLRRKLAEFRRSGAANLAFQEKSEGKRRIHLALSQQKIPVLRLSDGDNRLETDIYGDNAVVSWKHAGVELVRGGNIAKFALVDPKQPPLHFSFAHASIRDQVPEVVSKAVVAAYDGANPENNPLMGLEIFRTVRLFPDRISVDLKFVNPTEKIMEPEFRITNFPQTGARFGGKNIAVTSESVRLDSTSASDSVFFVPGTRSAFAIGGKTGVWKNSPVYSSSSDGGLQDRLLFRPDPRFRGLYVWNGGTQNRAMTVEFLSGVFRVKPGIPVSFQYNIEVK